MDTEKFVLIVDDMTESRLFFEDALGEYYNVISVGNELEAIEIIEAEIDCISAVIVNISGDESDGLEVLQSLRTCGGQNCIPVIVVASIGQTDKVMAVIENGATDFIVNPVDPKIVLRTVDNIVNQHEYMQFKNNIMPGDNARKLAQLGVFENIDSGIAIYKICGNTFETEYFNSRVCAMLGYTKKEYEEDARKSVMSRVNPDDRAEYDRLIKEAIERRTNFKYVFRCIKKDETEVWLRATHKILEETDEYIKYIGTYTDVDTEVRSIAELRFRTRHDKLTGIYNKETFFVSTQKMLKLNPGRRYVLLRWDIEKFKLINSLLGAEKGDEVLIKASKVIQEIVGVHGTYGRLEADHFAACIPEEILEIEDLVRRSNSFIEDLKLGHTVVLSVGAFVIDDITLPVDQMCDRANLALQTVKGDYEQHYAFFNETMQEPMLLEQKIRDYMQSALENHEFEVYLQPVYSISDNMAISAEALVRWNHPDLGMMSPGVFIPIFEKNGFILELDQYVWEEVCCIIKSRRDRGLDPLPISVNASRRSLYNANLCQEIIALTKKYDVDPELFKIEITETAYTDNPDQLLETVQILRGKGYPVLMDDFGSGYSSLNTLKDIQVDTLKIDMKFLQGFEAGGRVGTVLTSILRMAKWLNLPIVAEGVETPEQLEFLRSIGCDWIQGYCYAKPMPYEIFERFIADTPVLSKLVFSEFPQQEIDAMMGGNALINRLIGGLFGGFCVAEMSGDRIEVVRVNEGYYDLMGYDSVSFARDSLDVSLRYHIEDRDLVLFACKEAIKRNEPVSITARRYHNDGHLMVLDILVSHLGGGDENSLFCIAINDVTNQVETENRLEVILSNLGSGVALFEIGDTIKTIYSNDQYYKLNNLEPGESLNKNVLEMVYPEDVPEAKRIIDRAAKTGDVVEHQYRVVRKDGIMRWMHIRARVYPSSVSQKPVGIAVLTDITDQRNAELEREINKYSSAMFSVFGEIYELNYVKKTSRLLASRYDKSRVVGKTFNLDTTYETWMNNVLPKYKDGLKSFMDNIPNIKGEAKTFQYEYLDEKGKVLKISTVIVNVDRDIYLMCNSGTDTN